MSKLIIGLTGGIGSGKTVASDYLATLGVDVVDADVIARTITDRQDILQQLQTAFGHDIVVNGKLDRSALRAFVFDHPDMTTKLNAITHPPIRQSIIQKLTQATSSYAVLSAPLLLESHASGGLSSLCHRILVIDVNPEVQMSRASSRDGQSVDNIKAIIARQIDRHTRLELADDIVDNSGTLAMLYQQLDELHRQYQELAQAMQSEHNPHD